MLLSSSSPGAAPSVLDAGQPWYAPRVTSVAPGVSVLDYAPPAVPMSGPAIVATLPEPIGDGSAGVGVFQPPEVLMAGTPTPVATPPQGCSSCGAPAIVATAQPVVQMVTPAAQLPSSADLVAMLEKAPWWVWVILAILILRGLFK